MRVAILTISDTGALGRREDLSGAAIERWALGRGTCGTFGFEQAETCRTTSRHPRKEYVAAT